MRTYGFGHEKMPVYRLAVELYGAVAGLVAGLQWPLRWLSDQLLRACGSIVLNLAEGAAEYSPGEKARFYRMSLRSSGEVAAALDLLLQHHPDFAERVAVLRQTNGQVAHMLNALTQATNRRR